MSIPTSTPETAPPIASSDIQPGQRRPSRTLGSEPPPQTPGRERGSVELELGPEVGSDGRPTPSGWRWIGKKLREEMPSREFRGKAGRIMHYVTARQVQRRLDEVVGPGNWSTHVQVTSVQHPVSALVTLSVFGVDKSDVGYSNSPDAVDEYIPDLDPTTKRPIVDESTGEVRLRRNPNFEEEPLKAAVSDAFKRAAVQWGCARHLYPEMQSR